MSARVLGLKAGLSVLIDLHVWENKQIGKKDVKRGLFVSPRRM